jgi:glutathione S-transferase
MITLYTFGPGFGLPDPSPFVMKSEVQLKMSGLPYRTAAGQPMTAPKGKLPYIEDEGRVVADSTFIRDHLARQHGIDFDRGLTPTQRATGWAVERMLEDQLYWAMLHVRWIDDANFARGPAHFFDRLPEAVRDATREQIRTKVRDALTAHGMGRHSPAEVAELGARSLAAAATLLGDGPYLFGEQPCGADATLFAFAAGFLAPIFEGALPQAAREHRNLVAYRDRMMNRYYPEFRPAG